MMMDCPRCGFSQPKDRFCANCGLDIENYKPKGQSLLTQLKSDSRFQFGVALFIIVATAFIIYTRNQEKLDQMMISEEVQEEYETTYQEEVDDSDSPSPDPPPQRPELKAEKIKKAETSEATALGIIESEDTPPVTTLPTQIKIEFAEVTTNAGLDLLNRGETIGAELKGSRFFLEKTLSEFLSEEEGGQKLVTLTGSKSIKMENNSPHLMTFTAKPEQSEEENGLSLEVTLKSKDDTSLTIEVKGQVFIELKEAEPYSLNFIEEFKLKTGDTIALTGIIPPLSNSKESVLSALGGTPLSILDSQDFKNQNSDLFLFIQAQP